VRGRHTELITVYISAGFNINVVAKQLESEKSTAKNIKSKATQKAVLESLDTIIRELKLYKKTPENGMAIFAGNFADKEGQEDIQSFVLEPPKPLNTRLYRCDQTFVLEPLRELLEVEEVYGLVVMDRKEATFGLLEGKQIKVLRKLTSGVPGKVRAGGQCLSPDTLIMKSDGDLVRLDEGHNPMIILSENFNKEEVEDTPILAKWENEKDLFRITTCYPKFEIKSSKDHTFFIRNEKGIEEKSLCEIKEGDYLIMPEKINLYLEDQEINFVPKIKQEFNMKKVNIPEKINPDFAKILGYYLGDGSWEVDRLTFFEQRKEVADFYKNLLEETFGIEVKYLFRKSKNYHQLRIYSRIISQLFRRLFSEINKTLNDKIPGIILKSSDKSLAAFISGFFDAEGYVNEGRVALGINNKFLTRQLQFSLLRLGIISSINEYDNRKNPYSNNIRYTLAIDDIGSLKRFQEKVNFCSEEKKEKLNRIFGLRSNRNKVRQLIVNGREVAKILRNSGLNTRQFNCPLFFVNKRQMSKEIFKESILSKIEDEELKRRLELFYNSNLIAVKIAKIEKLNQEKTIDIETKNHNFLANGLIVHNSSQRIHRLTEGLAKEFFRRIAEHMKEIFFEMPRLKGILLGGPMPTKEDFLEEGNLVTALKEKVLGCVDLGYADEHGLDLLVEGSQEILASQEIIYEKKLLEDFFDKLGKEPKKTMYKEADVEKGLKYGAVQKLLISKKFDKKKADELTVKAESISAEVELISTETEEGMQFWNLGGVGAILRFEV
ncbi:MAG: hypothetical protein KKF56_04010, partial [Nanoarchaeota archaeon]|nr:hypothetical protein [Nanoarchaeota archaeon]